jgi:hypothetical protein
MIEKGRCLPPEKPSGRPGWQARGWPFVQAADAKGGSTWAADTVKVGCRRDERGQLRTQTQSLNSPRFTT